MPSYEEALATFEGYSTQVLGISVDHVPCLKAWSDSLEGISYPLLSDFWPHGQVARQYGVFREQEGKAERALFVVDKAGIVRYVDVHDIDEQPDNEEIWQVLRRLEPKANVLPPAVADTAQQPDLAPALVRPGERRVVLYCRPGCIDCRLARRFLDRNNVPYTEINVRTEPEAESRVREWTGGALISPVFDIDGQIIIDFKRAELVKALDLQE